MSYPDVVQLAAPFFVLALIAEALAIRFLGARGAYETRDTLTSLIMGAENVAAGILLGFVAWTFYYWVWEYRVWDLGSAWWIVVVCFLLDDLRYYVFHRIAHTCRWVWASHVNHHSSQHYNLSTALRQTWTGTFTFMMVLHVPLILLGFHPAMVFFVGGLNLLYQFWIHTETIRKMPWWFEAVMNTPSRHRLHHGRNAEYLDANYAGTLIIWDRMFGTFAPEGRQADHGLVYNLGTFNPIRVAFHEWVGIFRDVFAPGLSLRGRFLYAVAPPGWSHDGSRETSDSIKADYVRRRPEAEGAPGL